MSPNSDLGFKIEPFDGSNYGLWSFKMKMLLVSKGLWSAVCGEAVTAAKEQQAHAAIVLNLADSQLLHVIGAESAMAAWGKLAMFHRTQDMANRLWLNEKFASFKYTASSISGHVMELEELVMKMKSASCEPSEEDVCAVMLRSLPPSYETLVQAFRMAVTSFKFSDLVSKLIAEEVRQSDSAWIEDATALYANKKSGKQWSKKQQGRRSKKPAGACFNCGKIGHYARDCRSSRVPRDTTNDHSNVAFTACKARPATTGLWTVERQHICAKIEICLRSTMKYSAREIFQAQRTTRSSRFWEPEWSSCVYGPDVDGLMLVSKTRSMFKI